jgi:outer membrane protein W
VPIKNFSVGVKSFFLVVLVLAFLVPVNLFAQSHFYFSFHPGIYMPRSGDLNGFDNGFSGGVAFGFQFTPNIAAELGLGWFYTEGEKTVTIGGSARQQHYDIDVWPFTLTLKGMLPYGKWEFFGLAGGGIYSVSVPYSGNGYNHYPYPYYYNDYDYIWGGYLGGGIHYNITQRFFLGVEGKYLWTEQASFSGINGFKLDGVISNAVFGFRF